MQWAEQGFTGQKPDRGVDATEVLDPVEGCGVLDADTDPQVRRPVEAAGETTQPTAQTGL